MAAYKALRVVLSCYPLHEPYYYSDEPYINWCMVDSFLDDEYLRSQGTPHEQRGRAQAIIQYVLFRYGITRYKLIDVTTANSSLPGIYLDEVKYSSGILVTPEEALHISLNWSAEQGYYFYSTEKPDAPGYPATRQQDGDEVWQWIGRLQEQMRADPEVGVQPPLALKVREPGQPTTREREIITAWLTERECQHFSIYAVESGNHDLPGSLYPGEVQDISGLLVLPGQVQRFALHWHPEWQCYTLGDASGQLSEQPLEDLTAEQQAHIEQLRQALYEQITAPHTSEEEKKDAWLMATYHPSMYALTDHPCKRIKEQIAREERERRPRSTRPRVPRKLS
ncbi:hypothetical protein [Dictyobacter kobayashii]|uniref:Uncharacterized protein n=1 Tax=Dictyobacter kobayashii TaxID=2014872 RepID=A0A402ARF5_9CHLR|nr:hypothetical protein [Dictyobacter kobayashii]GCE21675.1 hypothetical protein KDK_54750 [Dictyobacter kobayashii]